MSNNDKEIMVLRWLRCIAAPLECPGTPGVDQFLNQFECDILLYEAVKHATGCRVARVAFDIPLHLGLV